MTSRVYVCTGNHFGRFVDWAIGEVVLGVPKAGRECLIFFLGLLRKHWAICCHKFMGYVLLIISSQDMNFLRLLSYWVKTAVFGLVCWYWAEKTQKSWSVGQKFCRTIFQTGIYRFSVNQLCWRSFLLLGCFEQCDEFKRKFILPKTVHQYLSNIWTLETLQISWNICIKMH